MNINMYCWRHRCQRSKQMQTWGNILFERNINISMHYSTRPFLQIKANFCCVENEIPMYLCFSKVILTVASGYGGGREVYRH